MTSATTENPLQVIIKESQLDITKAKYILENFQNYFEIAAEWEAKAKTLIVTSPFQKAEMEQARDGRLFLREKRIAIENSRKKLKEDALREGKAIDGIANVLKALIVPIEEYLDNQEHFVEIENKKKEDAHRAEVEKRMADEQAQKEKEEAEKAEKLRLENEKLKKEAAEKDKKAAADLAVERAKTKAAKDKADAQKVAADEKARAEREKADAEKRVIEDKARKEKEAQEKKAATEREKAEEEKRRTAAAAKKKLDAEREEKERLEELLRKQVKCPKCNHKFVPEGAK